MLFNTFILINSFLIANPNINTINKNINIKNIINNVKMGFEEIDGDYDEYGNNINNTFNLYINHELNSTNDSNNFPSFYQFLREREINELKAKEEYLVKRKNKILNKTINSERYEIIEPTSKDLKLLSSLSTGEWMRIWLYEMIHVPDYFPTFMYQDMFRMREFSQKNNSKNYFYIGYYPIDVNLKHGPFYIGAFELIPNMREFRTFIIVQNPYHCADNIYDVNKIKDFKKELLALCNDSSVFFKFSNLQNTSDQRYFYSWLYEE